MDIGDRVTINAASTIWHGDTGTIIEIDPRGGVIIEIDGVGQRVIYYRHELITEA